MNHPNKHLHGAKVATIINGKLYFSIIQTVMGSGQPAVAFLRCGETVMLSQCMILE
jgi:hypothetical protein